ncbi:MAG: hypothetical protein ACRC9L_05055 [Brevinema sp.]
MAFILFWYIPTYENLWISWSKEALDIISSPLLKEVWYIAVFFRAVWPALLMAVIGFAVDTSAHPFSGRYRAMKKFSHTKVVLLLFVLAFYGLFVWKFSFSQAEVLLLNILVYIAAWYWRFGYSTILFSLKKGKISYTLGALLLFGSIITAGEAFFLPIFLIVGIGISDIWMDYHKRSVIR